MQIESHHKLLYHFTTFTGAIVMVFKVDKCSWIFWNRIFVQNVFRYKIYTCKSKFLYGKHCT